MTALPSPISERRRVSRKTAGEGRLEITESLGKHLLAAPPSPLVLAMEGRTEEGRVVSVACACRGTAENAEHQHFFLESTMLKVLPAEREVTLTYDPGRGRVDVAL